MDLPYFNVLLRRLPANNPSPEGFFYAQKNGDCRAATVQTENRDYMLFISEHLDRLCDLAIYFERHYKNTAALRSPQLIYP